MDPEIRRAVILTSLFGPVGAMGLLKKDKEPKVEKPREPKPVVLSPEEKAIAADRTRRFREAFEGEGYDFTQLALYEPRTLMTPRWSDFDPRTVHPLDTPPVATTSHIAVGRTDGRIYAAWMFTRTVTVGLEIRELHTHVAGIFLGSAVPTMYASEHAVNCDTSYDAEGLFSPTVREVIGATPAGGAVWTAHGWLLTDFLTLHPDLTIVMAAWRYLDSVISAMDPNELRAAGCDFGEDMHPVTALSPIFPAL